MEFRNLGKQERKLLLTALEFDIYNLRCEFCDDHVDFESCGIMPSYIKQINAIITCNSPLCMAQYLENLENEKKDE